MENCDGGLIYYVWKRSYSHSGYSMNDIHYLCIFKLGKRLSEQTFFRGMSQQNGHYTNSI
jgi:hypothetical protein